jgi:hypothetical protein
MGIRLSNQHFRQIEKGKFRLAILTSDEHGYPVSSNKRALNEQWKIYSPVCTIAVGHMRRVKYADICLKMAQRPKFWLFSSTFGSMSAGCRS